MGSTTLPDLRGEFIRGWDHGRGVDGGRGLRTWQKDAMNIDGSVTFAGATKYWVVNYATGSFKLSNAGRSGIKNRIESGSAKQNQRLEISDGDENRPRNISLMYIMRVLP